MVGPIADRVSGKDELAGIRKADGWIAIAEVEIQTIGPTQIISADNPFYPIESTRLKEIDVSAIKLKKNKDLWLLDVPFFFLWPRLGSNLIVGGDFNYSRLLDELYGNRGNNEFFYRIQDEGFISFHRKFHGTDEQTFFGKKALGHQLGYLYGDNPIAKHLRSCDVVSYNQVKDLSDHAPLIADLEIGPK